MNRALKRSLAHVPPGGRVLDVPCGTGQYCWFIAQLGFQTVAADLAPEMVKVAATPRAAGATNRPQFLVEDVFRLSFPARSFDGAVCIRLFNLLDRPERVAALGELHRVASTIIASYAFAHSFNSLTRWCRYKLGRRAKPKPRLSRPELEQEVSEAGLEVRQFIRVAPLLSEVVLVVLGERHA
jgi:SAM-dependent methyltransferase